MEYLTFSAPGRVELGGNHTDHQHGCVLAAAIDRTARARVRPTGEGVVRVFSRGYAPVELAPDDLSPRQEERNTTAALVRGMAAAFARRGILWQGFDAWVESDVLPGSGLSSSAAFEVLLGRIGNALFPEIFAIYLMPAATMQSSTRVSTTNTAATHLVQRASLASMLLALERLI